MSRWQRRAGRRHQPGLMPLDDALQALGRDGKVSRHTGDVPIADIVGSQGRPFDFDHEFRPLTKQLQPRWQRLFAAVDSGFEPPPVDLVQLGELYFVRDGHREFLEPDVATKVTHLGNLDQKVGPLPPQVVTRIIQRMMN